ncbi:MAG: hypothetical protein E7062_09680 [Spirochaetaceae bacterium]|nr:hypothetical protein [Spirochaetaceae bacterium]
MKKNKLIIIPLFIYEIIRLFFIISTKPVIGIETLPLSWYMSIPFLIFPTVFMYFYFFEKEFFIKKFSGIFYFISKNISMAGMVIYIINMQPFIIEYGYLSDFNAFYRTQKLLIFFIIDGILSLGFLLKSIKLKTSFNEQSQEGE